MICFQLHSLDTTKIEGKKTEDGNTILIIVVVVVVVLVLLIVIIGVAIWIKKKSKFKKCFALFQLKILRKRLFLLSAFLLYQNFHQLALVSFFRLKYTILRSIKASINFDLQWVPIIRMRLNFKEK